VERYEKVGILTTAMSFRNTKASNWLGSGSVVLSIVPLIYISHPEILPDASLTEATILIGGVGGSLLMALGAGFLGSRWWLLAILGSVLDAVLIFAFSP
jgi:hypothetical protein